MDCLGRLTGQSASWAGFNGSMDEVKRVQKPPRSAELYARAVAGSVLPSPLWGGGNQLPNTALELSVEIDRDHLARYAQVCRFADTNPVPPTYPHVLGFPLAMQIMTGREFPLPVLGMVHVANTITSYRPLDPTEPLTVRVSAADLRPHHLGAQVDLRTEALVTGETVWEERSTYLARGSKAGGDGEPEPRREWPQPSADATVTDLQIGGDIGRRYAEISGDRNPIHLSSISAKAFGFPRAIAHGMWTLAVALAEAGELPDAFTAEAAFRKPVLLPADARLRQERSAEGLTSWITGRDPEKVHLVLMVRQ